MLKLGKIMSIIFNQQTKIFYLEGKNVTYSFCVNNSGYLEHLQVTGGINDFDFSWLLGENEEFETPEIVIAYSAYGIGGMSREFHNAYRNHLINRRFVNKERPIVINNWEATYFDFDNEKLMRIVDAALFNRKLP